MTSSGWTRLGAGLGFVARRLAADPVGLVFAAREGRASELARLPELAVEGLEEGDARALLDSVLAGPLDARVRDQIVTETRGNPLALLELPAGRDRGGVGGRVRAAGRGAAGGSDRGELPAAAGGAAGRDPAAAATRGGRPVGDPRWCGGQPGGSRPGEAATRGRGGLVDSAPACGFAPTGPLGGLPVGVGQERGGPPRAGGGHRCGGRSRPPRLAPGAGRAGAGRGVADELECSAGRAQAAAAGRSGRVLERAALLTPDPLAGRSGCSPPPSQARRRGVRCGPGAGGGRGGPWTPQDRGGRAPARADRWIIAAASDADSAPQRGQAPRAARRRVGARDVPGRARGRDVGRATWTDRRAPRGGRGRAHAPPVLNRRVRWTFCSTRRAAV